MKRASEFAPHITQMMKDLNIVGYFGIDGLGAFHHGWVGKPGDGEDYEILVTVRKLPHDDEESA